MFFFASSRKKMSYCIISCVFEMKFDKTWWLNKLEFQIYQYKSLYLINWWFDSVQIWNSRRKIFETRCKYPIDRFKTENGLSIFAFEFRWLNVFIQFECMNALENGQLSISPKKMLREIMIGWSLWNTCYLYAAIVGINSRNAARSVNSQCSKHQRRYTFRQNS